MNVPHSKFCVLPWVSLEASPIGTVRPCCLARSEIVNDSGTKFSLGESSLADIQNSEHMRSLRRAFLAAEEPADCERCWSEERAGRTSKRMHTLARLQHMIDDNQWDENSKSLQFLDLKLGNICNLKCRICGSWSSSTYAAEEIRYQQDKKNNFHYVMMKLGRWPREEQRFWQDLEKHMSAIRYLEFTGGEPFMIEEHFDLLRKLVAAGHASNIEIHYNTNGTIYPSDAEAIWKHFKHVEIAFSIDDVGERFEYQRSGAEWHMVNGHVDLFREMRSRNKNITLQVCATVNVFNAMYLEDLANWIDRQNFDFVYWNILHDPNHLCIASLTQETKNIIASRLHQADVSHSHALEFVHIENFMMAGESKDPKDLLDYIRKIDSRRQQNLKTHHLELAESLNYV